jgi:dipeptidyl aminopeptidase/acylaminoacyl peptidase
MSQFRRLTLLLLSAVLLTACSDDDPVESVHHVNPLWTPDGKTIVAGYDAYTSMPGDAVVAPQAPPSRLAVMDFATRATRIVDLVQVSTWHALYAFDPSGAALTFVQQGAFWFYDLQGRLLLRHVPAEGGEPRLLAYNNTGNSFLWAGATAFGYSVNLTTYDASTWTILQTMTLFSDTTTDAVISLIGTSQRSFAVRGSSGLVREIDFDGTEINSFPIKPLTADNPWHQRLIYYTNGGARYIYAIDSEGLMRLDLATGAANQLVKGLIVDFDISESRRSLLYETHTGDTWLSSQDAIPLSRIAPQNLMPRFSPAANGIALVERISPERDSLHVLLLR